MSGNPRQPPDPNQPREVPQGGSGEGSPIPNPPASAPRPSSGNEVPTLDPASSGRGEIGCAPAHGSAATSAIGEKPGTFIGPYKLIATIGEGGFGVVWLAEQREPIARRVALKVIKPGMDTRAVVARFEQERQALALMDHPNVAKVFDAGATAEGRPYFVMEYVQGVPITEFCDRTKSTIRQRLELFIPVCEAVQHAHSKGIIHRDIKPTNVLIEVVDGKPVPKVIDFGVAKAISQALTEKTLFTDTGQILGTPEYMSPEQAGPGAADVDTRTDVYSLGVLLYELLTGVLPFDSRSLRSGGYAEIQRIIREVDPPHPSVRLSSLGAGAAEAANRRGTQANRLSSELRRELEWIPLKAMRKERDERYRTPIELAEDVRNYLTGKPLVAGPESVGYRAKKFIRRNRAVVVTTAAIVLAIIGGLIGTTYGLVEARRGYRAARESQAAAEREAERARLEASRAEGVNRVFEDLLSRSSPRFSGKADLTLGYVMRIAGAALDKDRFAASPEIEAGLRSAIAAGERGIGDFAAAEVQYRKAVDLERIATLRSDTRLARRLRQLGSTLVEMGRVKDARGAMDEAAGLLAGAPDAPREERRELDLALAALAEASGDLKQAAEKYAALEADVSGTGKSAEGVAGDTRIARAILARRIGKTAEALGLFEKLADDMREGGSQGGTTFARVLCELGLTQREAGQWPDAEASLRESLVIYDKVLGTGNAYSAWVQRGLGGVLRDSGRADEAEALERAALETRRKVFGAQSLVVAQSLDGWAGALADLGRFDEAAAAYREAVTIRESALGGDALDVAAPLTGLADVLTRAGKAEEAVRSAERALSIRQARLPAGHWMIASTQSVLGGALSAAGRFDEAERSLVAAYDAMKTDPGAAKRRLPEVVSRLIALYQRWEKPEEQARWERVRSSGGTP